MRILTALLAVAGLLLAGCSGPSGKGTDQEDLDVTKDTGGIRGVVVDQAIKPIFGALVSVDGSRNVTTGNDGTFNFTGLQPGGHILQVTKPGFRGTQVAAAVEAGVADPPVVKVLLEAISQASAFVDHLRLDGYYECAFSHGEPGDPIITDSCDFGYRTAWDAYNESAPSPAPKPLPAPRTLQRSVNTQYATIGSDAFTIIQEAYWKDDNVPVMMILLSSTPINNACDCSDVDYLDVTMASPTMGRLERYKEDGTENKGFPDGLPVAARGFLSWESTATATNLAFTVITSVFHNYVPDPAWTFENKESFPVP